MKDPVWLADPARVLPITVDPTYATMSMDANFDTFVQKGYTTDQSGATELRLGTYDGGTTVARSFLGFPLGSWRNYQVMDADLSLYATHSYSCSARNWSIYSSGAASTATRWTAQPHRGYRRRER